MRANKDLNEEGEGENRPLIPEERLSHRFDDVFWPEESLTAAKQKQVDRVQRDHPYYDEKYCAKKHDRMPFTVIKSFKLLIEGLLVLWKVHEQREQVLRWQDFESAELDELFIENEGVGRKLDVD